VLNSSGDNQVVIELRRATAQDVPAFVAMEQAPDTAEYIIPYSRDEHERKIADPNLVYLKIVDDGHLAGFFILVLDADGKSVEFKRIVVSAKERGIGQFAIASMESFCSKELRRSRIWLDVFEHNHRGRHIYEKLGYTKYGEAAHGGRRLWLYEKSV
jgi:RimJ/RimL family protein N-acetyltransferase